MFSDTVLIALITAVPPTLMALAGVIMAFRNASKLKAVAEQTNGMSQRLERIARSEGEGVGQIKERQRADDAVIAKDKADGDQRKGAGPHQEA